MVTVVVAGLLVSVVPASAGEPVDTMGTVTRVVDGDTVIARIKGKYHRIRITGLNAMERTECHAAQATKRLEKLVLGKQVRITARDKDSHSGERLRRSLRVQHEGRSIDPAEDLISKGLALWMPNEIEYGPNDSYPVLAQQAASAGRGLWNTTACGAGPSRKASLRVTVQWEGQEKVFIENRGPKPVSLARWWVRDSSFHEELARGYQFPNGTVVPAGGTIVLHIQGPGDNGGGHYFWRLPKPVFDNVTGKPTFMADGAYLFDPQGDLRAAQQYAPHAFIQFPAS